MEQYWFQNNQYCNVQNMQKVIVGCWKCDFDKILLLYSKNKSIIWIYRWTRWTTRWQPAQFRQVVRCPSNCTRIDGSGALTTRTANVETGRFWPVPGSEAPVLNRCYWCPWPWYGEPSVVIHLPSSIYLRSQSQSYHNPYLDNCTLL